MRILIVDDEKSIRFTLSELLSREGYCVQSTEDAQKAIEILTVEDYDLVVTDIVMPFQSGMTLLENVRQRCPDTQVIMMTGEPTVDTAIQAVRAGAFDYLIKPINKESIIRVVHQAVRMKALTTEKQRLTRINLEYQEKLELLVHDRTEALQKAMQHITSLVSSVVEIRDQYTAGHQRRVGNLAAAIAQEMGCKSDVVDGLRVTGYMHDIGKIVVPAEILVKPGKLSAPELEIIRSHAWQGYELLKNVNLPWPIAETVLQHHERLNGSGYPQKLKGQEIRDNTQILIVADVVEAMMSHRPYRAALGIAAALSEISENAGQLYDSEVVDTCIQLFRNQGYSLENEARDINFSY